MSGRAIYSGIMGPALLLAVLVLVPQQGNAQGDLPDRPDIIRVTVDHSDNGVLIQWEPSEDDDIEFYKLYRMINRTGQEVVTLPGNVYEYKHMDTGLKNLEYSVTAIDSSGNESLLTPGEHRAVSVSLQFDTCSMANLVTWSAYVGWEGSIAGYRIFGGRAGHALKLLGFVSPATLSFNQEAVDRDTAYSYYIETVNLEGITSLSPIDTIGTHYPRAPGFIFMDYVSVVDRHSVELQFSADVSGPVRSFRLMKRNDASSPFSEVTVIRNTGQETHLMQDQFPTSVETFEYIVQSIFQPEGCADPVVLAESNPGTNILLESGLADQTASLSWTPYREYPAGLSGYVIQRRDGSGDFFDVQSVGPGTTRWTEPINSIIDGFQTGEVQYRILAVANPGGTGDPGISTSNVVSVDIPTDMILPNAFTPGSNDMNFEFKPRIDFAPKKYTMIIYDRAGRKLFESSDPGEGWDGRFHGGDFVDEGVYVYYIQYTDYTGLFRTITGNVTVLYP
jgi:gliding motility-associated-like protein